MSDEIEKRAEDWADKNCRLYEISGEDDRLARDAYKAGAVSCAAGPAILAEAAERPGDNWNILFQFKSHKLNRLGLATGSYNAKSQSVFTDLGEVEWERVYWWAEIRNLE